MQAMDPQRGALRKLPGTKVKKFLKKVKIRGITNHFSFRLYLQP